MCVCISVLRVHRIKQFSSLILTDAVHSVIAGNAVEYAFERKFVLWFDVS